MTPLPSVTSNFTARFSPRTRLPGATSPPSRMRVPGAICFSETSVGELKNTIESLSAVSTSAAAMPSTPTPAAIRARRRCLRVIVSALDTELFYAILEAAELVRLVGQRAAGIAGGSASLVPIAQHHIGAQEPQPAVRIGTVALQPLGKPGHHAADHLAAIAFAHLRRCGHVLGARPGRVRSRCALFWRARRRPRSRSRGRLRTGDARQCRGHERDVRRAGGGARQNLAEDAGSGIALAVLFGGHAEIES